MVDQADLPRGVVAIGASAGGLNALKAFFSAIEEPTGLAFVVVVHLAPDHESHLPEVLQPACRMPVLQVTETMHLQADQVYVIPPNRNLNSIDSHLRLSALEEARSDRAPVDHFFRTLATTHDGNSVGVILSGTGADGSLGLLDIAQHGGLTIAQAPEEAEYDDMPRHAIDTGRVDRVLPIAKMLAEIRDFIYTTPRIPVEAQQEDEAARGHRQLHSLLSLLRVKIKYDFSRYKSSTILRRIRRRMQLLRIEDLEQYIAVLRKDTDELTALADDFLITVTSFFRDPEVFACIGQDVLPALLKAHKPGEAIRVWSVGCATGQEVYSLAMLLAEAINHKNLGIDVQIFASDLHLPSLKRAREGLYPGDIEADVSNERLQRFFEPENEAYRIRKEIRDMIVFAPHNLLVDPPFSRIDLLLCRNLLIYLQRGIQPELIKLFHYALKPGGWLVLGSAENVETPDLFTTKNKTAGVYQKRSTSRSDLQLPVHPAVKSPYRPPTGAQPTQGLPTVGALHHRIVERYAPPSLLLSAEDKVVHFSENAGRYLVHPGGVPTTNVFKLVREELQIELRSVVQNARDRQLPAASHPVALLAEGTRKQVIIQARPTPDSDNEKLLLVIFDEQDCTQEPAASPAQDAPSRELALEVELVRKRLQSSIAESDASKEEMQAFNEELQSINEELQTANQENRQKVAELSQLSSDLQQLMAATNIATLFLDRELRILRFTPQVGDLFNLRNVDRGRPISDLTHRLGYAELMTDARDVLDQLTPVEREVQDDRGIWYLATMRPYRNTEDRIEGLVLTFVDISASKKSEKALTLSEQRYRTLFQSIDEGFCVVNVVQDSDGAEDFELIETNSAYDRLTNPKHAKGALLKQAAPKHFRFWSYILETLGEDKELERFECQPEGFNGWLEVYAFRISCAQGIQLGVLAKDIDEKKRGEAQLAVARRNDAFRIAVADAIRGLSLPAEIKAEGCRQLAEYLQLDRVEFQVCSGNDKPAAVAFGTSGEAVSGFQAWRDNPALLLALEKGQVVAVNNSQAHQALTLDQKAYCLRNSINAHLSIPLIKDRLVVAVLTVDQRRARHWGSSDVGLIGETAERVWTAIERAEAEQALRQSETALRQADSKKNEFLAMLSHELRNPLTPITNTVHILEHSLKKDPEKAALNVISRQVALLSRLVDDLLDLTRIVSGNILVHRQTLDLADLLMRTVEDHRLAFENKGIGLDFQPPATPIWVSGDEKRLAQAIGNVLQNSAKFTQPAGHTRVGIKSVDGVAQVMVSDNGQGMAPDIQAQLFQPFVQGDKTLDRSQGGLGLGLALTKRLLELQHGEIEAFSGGENQGTSILIRLPLCAQPEALPPAERQPAVVARTKRRVLIIEDNRDAAETLSQALQLHGHEVALAFDGEQGLGRTREWRPDTVLCDIGLPGMTGFGVAKAMRKDTELSQPLLIALSGYATPGDAQQTSESGFDYHLAKPVSLPKLLELLDQS